MVSANWLLLHSSLLRIIIDVTVIINRFFSLLRKIPSWRILRCDRALCSRALCNQNVYPSLISTLYSAYVDFLQVFPSNPQLSACKGMTSIQIFYLFGGWRPYALFSTMHAHTWSNGLVCQLWEAINQLCSRLNLRSLLVCRKGALHSSWQHNTI